MFNQRQPRKFKYRSRLPDSKNSDSKEELKAKWDAMRGNTNRKQSLLTSMPALIIFLICVMVLMYILNGYLK